MSAAACHPNDRTGAQLAYDMMCELSAIEDVEEGCPIDEDNPLCVADLCRVEDHDRHGLPFRNIAFEYLQEAQAAGPKAVEAFCAVLSDYVSFGCQGLCRNVDGLQRVYQLE